MKYSALAVVLLLLASIIATANNVFADSPNLTVSTKDDSGNPLPGYWVEVRQGGSLIQSGFSPVSFTLATGSYEVAVGDYGSYFFKEWSDGTKTRSHPVTIASTGLVSLTAIYSTTQQTTPPPSDPEPEPSANGITVSSQYVDGSSLVGMYVTLQQNGATIATGFTPVTFSVTADQQYTIIPSDYTNAFFNKWSDGATARAKTVTATSAGLSLTALYTTSQQSSPPPSEPTPPSDPTPPPGTNLSVNTKDEGGNPLPGYWVEVRQGGSVVKTGFSPVSFTLAAGSYTVSVGDYGSYFFKQWSDGTATREHPVTIGSTGSVSLTAIYSTTQQQTPPPSEPTPPPSDPTPPPSSGAPNTVTVVSKDLKGNPLTGMYVNLRLNGAIVKEGFTPVTFTLEPGKEYVVVMYWCCDYEFRHFTDGVLTRYHFVTPNPSGGINLDAKYELVPASQAAKLNVHAFDEFGNYIGGTTGSDLDGTLSAKPGMWMWLTKQGDSSPYSGAYTGSSSTPFRVFNGQQYTVAMSSFGEYEFSHWQDNGSTNPTRTFTMNGNSENNVAIYKVVATSSSTTSMSDLPFPWYDVDNQVG